LDYVPPELREDQGEIEAAAEHRLPQLITFSDLKGDLHVHTNWSDGHNTIDEMAQAAAAMGYGYIAICDHSKGLGIANGMSEDKALQQLEEIRGGSYPIKVLAGIEVDIRADGTYDYPVDLLEKFDIVVASVHSALNQDAATMTRRIDRALDAFAPTILGHPTGRMLNKRDGINVDMNFIMACCRTHNVAMEINAAPDRLDLDDINARLAVQRGVKLAINTDAHNVLQLGWVYYGIYVAQRAWVTKEDLYYYGGA
jgi:DNA polymerase (family 10)